MKLAVKPEIYHLLTDISRFFASEGICSYLVGGFVRDVLLGRDTADIDIVVGSDALETAQKAALEFGGKYIMLDKENGVGRVVLPQKGWGLDFTTLKRDIENDLSQRDFTINAIAIELGRELMLDTNKLIDPFGGWNDLRQCILRAVSDSAFESDAARLIRAVRLAAELNLIIDINTELLIRRSSHLVGGVAGERLREELLRILSLPKAGQMLAYLDELGLLTALIPELALARGVSQPKVHVWDVFEHSIRTVSAIEFLLREGPWKFASREILNSAPWSERLAKHFSQEINHGSTRQSLLKLAALLHDIAKPQTKTLDEDGRARFLGHHEEGAIIAASILERLRFSTRETKLVELMVKNHLRPTQMSHEALPTNRAVYRYFRDTEETGIDILFLSLADHLATRGASLYLAEWQEHTCVVDYVLKKYFEEEGLSAPTKLIDGHDLINIFRIEPGSGIGEILQAVREAQAIGEVTSREEAIHYVKLLLEKQDLHFQKELS